MSNQGGAGSDGSQARHERARLTFEDVLEAAETIIDRSGWDQLTMTDLAAELGVRVPSLYHHVRNLDALKAAVQVRTMSQLGAELRAAAMGRTGEDGLRALANVQRSFAHRFPRRYEGATRAPLDRPEFITAALDANEALVAMVRSYGLEGEAALYAETSAFAALHGFITLEISGFFEEDFDRDRVFEGVLDGAVSIISSAAGAVGPVSNPTREPARGTTRAAGGRARTTTTMEPEAEEPCTTW